MLKKYTIEHNGETIAFAIKSVRRSKALRLLVREGGAVTVTKPFWVPIYTAKAFVNERLPWLAQSIAKMKAYREGSDRLLYRGGAQEYRDSRKQALAFVRERAEAVNREHYGFAYGKISVRNQKTRWGSCSRGGNLSFNYRLILLPPELADYVVAHELCHLREFNHSEDFWRLVAKACPNYRVLRQKLRLL